MKTFFKLFAIFLFSAQLSLTVFSKDKTRTPEISIKVYDANGGGIDYLNVLSKKEQSGILESRLDKKLKFRIKKDYQIISGNFYSATLKIRLEKLIPEGKPCDIFTKIIHIKINENKDLGIFFGNKIEVEYK